MGRLVRRFIRTTKVQGGTWASPIAMYIASQIACQMVHSVAIAGTAEGALFGVKCNISSGNLSLYGVHAKANVLTGKNTGTGKILGVYVEIEALGTGVVGGTFEGIDVETYVESDATITGDHYGIYVKTYSDISGNQEIVPLRLEHNGASVANAFIGVYAQTGKMRYFLTSSHTAETWVDVTGTPADIAGWLKIKLGGYDRWIALYSTSP